MTNEHIKGYSTSFSSVQFIRSVMSNSLRPHESQHAKPPCPLLKLMCIESVMPSSHLILCRPLLLLPPIPPSIRVFSNESTLRMRWPKYWSGLPLPSPEDLPNPEIEPRSLSSVQFSRSVMSNSLRPHELQHARPLCPSPIPGVHPNSCPSSW